VKRFEIIVKNTVQKVGYRDYVEEVARRLGIEGFVENVKDGTVRIVCETDEETVKKFIHEINIKKGLIEVEDVQIKSVGIATGEFKYFEIKYGPLEEEIGERMVMAVKYASAMWSDIKTMSQNLKEVKQDIKEMKQDLKEVKQDIKEMKQDIKEVKQDIKEIKQDIKEMKQDIKEIKGDVKEVLKKQDETIKEIRKLRSDLKSYLDERFKKIEEEIRIIKARIGLA
jgi:acylphosphatase/DNA-binding ferritin-like protein